MEGIKINGHVLEAVLLIEDPDVKQAFTDASGGLRHVRAFSQPGRLKSFLRRHSKGLILAGVGNIFFLEPVPVSSAMVRFDESGSADILIKEGAEWIERQLTAMEAIHKAAEDESGHHR